MATIRHITPDFAVAGALQPHDFETLAARGIRTVINFRPDNEASGQLPAETADILAARAGLKYNHIPAAKFDVFDDSVIEKTLEVMKAANGPVLAHCASGQRAVMVWAAAAARSRQPVEGVLDTLKAAGFDFGFLRDDLNDQAERAVWAGEADSHAHHQPLTEEAAAA